MNVQPEQWVDGRTLKELVDGYERALLVSALKASGGHQRRAARALGLLPTTLCEKLKRLGLRGAMLPEPSLAEVRPNLP